MTVAYSAADELVSAWDVVGVAFTVNEADGTLSFDASAGQTYTIGLGTQAGIGHYTLDVSLEADVLPPDGEAVRQLVLADQSVSAAGQWFAFAAAQDGILTVDASFANAAGDVDLQLYDAAERLIGGSYGVGDTERIDVIVSAGDTFYVYAYTSGAGTNPDVELRVTNMVAQSAAAVDVTGTDGDDSFVFTAGTTHEFVVNGVSYRFGAQDVDTITFDGLGGEDTATLTGGAGADTAKLTPDGAELSGQDYTVIVADTEDVTVNSGGGGTDVAFLYDSPGDDVFIATPSAAHLFGPGYSSRAVGFRYAHAYATARGNDIAYLHDSAGDDVFVATPAYGKLYGDNYLCRAKYFEAVHAYATRGGNDTAYFYGSAGDDLFESTSVYSRLTGQGYLNRAKYFEDIQVRGGQGGTDRAQLADSQSNDQLSASGNTVRLTSTDRTVWLQAFSDIDAYAVTGGNDRAEVAAVDYLLRLLGDWQQ